MSKYAYQHAFSSIHHDAVHNPEMRRRKARKTLAVIADWAKREGLDTESLALLDVGSSAGYLTRYYAEDFGTVAGIDIDVDAVRFAREHNGADRLYYTVADSMAMPFANGTFDAATCSHVYEHVPDAQRMMEEIHRVLKPGGFCYFAAANRFAWMEAHYRLPLLGAIPKPLAHLYLRVLRRGTHYYETHLSYWALKRLIRRFQLTDYTLRVVREPEQFSLTEIVAPNSLKQRLALSVLPFLYWLAPTYIWILRKPLA